VILIAIVGVATLLCYLTFISTDARILIRCLIGLGGIGCCLVAAGALRQTRTWTRLSLRKGRLEVTIPSFLGFKVQRYLFSSFADATVGRSRSKRDHGTYLLLHRHSGAIEQLLENVVYRTGDLELVAEALREAIARRQAVSLPKGQLDLIMHRHPPV
jgi:hypothetical protein